MDFGSKYVYKYDCSSDESISDSDNDEMSTQVISAEVQPAAIAAAAPEDLASLPLPPPAGPLVDAVATVVAPLPSKRKKRLRKADTNVVSIKFNRLLQPGEMHAGDPVYCSKCGSIPSHLSQIRAKTAEQGSDTLPASEWQCEFCPTTNTVDIEQNDLPKKEDATYLLAPAPIVHGSDMTGVDDSIIIFLIDVSGSMSSTTLVQGNFQLPNALQQQQHAAAHFDGERMIRQRHQTYVSRLQGVQMAVDANLDKLLKDAPTRRAAFLTFNHEITYYGDGTRDEPLVIRGDKLNSAEDLLREAEREQHQELKPIGQTKTRLTERVYELEEGGQTALGPAVLFALSIASKRRGSKIVICTDGLANRGLGNLELAQDENVEQTAKMQALEQGNEFYADLTERARGYGTTISVITIKGTTCLLSVIGQMADGTGGNVNIVDLMNIRDEFASILEQKIIATNVEATLVIHQGLYVRDPDNPEEKLEKIKRNIGNVTKQTEVTFEFGVRNKQELKEKYQIDLNQLKQLPFQIQVTYTASDGSKALRVLTQLKETTNNREVAEINAYRTVIAENHIRSTAQHMMRYDDDDDDDDDDDEEGNADSKISHKRGVKWSSPTVQKQRMAYMAAITERKARHLDHDTDRFSETIWNKTSSELKSHVDSSKHRKVAQSRAPVTFDSAAAAPSTGGTSIFNRFTNLFSRADADGKSTESSSKKPASKKSYGFASSNIKHHTDKGSEDLYRYKNFSSEQMRSTSPVRELEPAAIAPVPDETQQKVTEKPMDSNSSDGEE